MGLLAFLCLRLWKGFTGFTDKHRHIITVIHISNIEIILCTFIWRTHIHNSQQGTPRIRWFHIEAIIADKPKNLPIAINSIVAKHLLGNNLTRSTTLLCNILHKIRITCHT